MGRETDPARNGTVGPGEAERHAAYGIDRLSRLGIAVGAPVTDPARPYIHIPALPHVFVAESLTCTGGPAPFCIADAVILTCHGFVHDGHEWIVRDTGEAVRDVVGRYGDVARRTGLPPVDALIVCRPFLPDTRSVTVRFSWIDVPVVVPTSDVLVKFADVTDRHDMHRGVWFGPGRGVGPVIAVAGGWEYADLHASYWSLHDRAGRLLPAPYRDMAPLSGKT